MKAIIQSLQKLTSALFPPEEENIKTYNKMQVHAGLMHLKKFLGEGEAELSENDSRRFFKSVVLKDQMTERDIDDIIQELGALVNISEPELKNTIMKICDQSATDKSLAPPHEI